MLLKDLIKIYFLEYPTINFSQIKQTIKEYEKAVEKCKSIGLPSWVKGKAKDVSFYTFNFIEGNKHLLSPSKQSFTYQEYQELLKFKPALQNLDILAKEDKKVQRIVTRSNVEKKWSSSLFLFFFWTIVITIILVSLELYSFLAIYYFFSISFVTCILIVNKKYRQWFFSIKDNGEVELQHQINLSNKKINKNIYSYF